MFQATPAIVAGWTDKKRADFFNGTSTIEGGIEVYERPVGPEVVTALSRQGDNTKKYFCSSIYRLRPKPEPEDILSIKLRESDSHYSILEVAIARGHYVLLDFFKSHVVHGGFSTQLIHSKTVISCNCGATELLYTRSIR